MRLFLGVLGTITLLVGSEPIRAEGPVSPDVDRLAQQYPRTRPRASPEPSRPSPARDPTQPSTPLREAIDASQMGPKEGGGLGLPPVPRFAIKARVVGPAAPPMAMLSIDDKVTIIVQAGRLYQIPQSGGASYQIKVREITTAGVELDLLPINVPLILQ